MPQGARTNHFARGPLGGSYGPAYGRGLAIIDISMACDKSIKCVFPN